MDYIGIDIGGTKIAGGVVTVEGKIIARAESPTPIAEGGKRILEEAIAIAKSLLLQASARAIQGIGIGAGGQIDTVQGIVYSATDVIPGWKGMHITDGFSKALGLSSAVENDVNVLGLAETRFGAARPVAKGTVIFLALGTGVGGALLLNGVVHHGAHWSGAEFGHILLNMDADARRDLGGAPGTLEAYCSGAGLVQTWKELSGSTDSSITGHDVVRYAEKDPEGPAAIAIRRTGEYLGCGLASLANALDPDLIIVGGGLSELGEALLGPARESFKRNTLPGPGLCQIILPQLGIDAPIVGAASLVMPASIDAVPAVGVY